MLPPAFPFTGRNRRPPRDPVNALLSFGYVLAGTEIQSLLDGLGFDPFFGFFHQIEYGRPSLALDLLEEFRAPLIDRFTLRLLNLGLLREADFGSDPESGVRLKKESLARFFELYQRELTTPIKVDGEELSYRHLFRRQAERLGRALTEGLPYEPFRLPS